MGHLNKVTLITLDSALFEVLENSNWNVDEVSFQYYNPQQYDVKGSQPASNLPAHNGAQLRIPKQRFYTLLKI